MWKCSDCHKTYAHLHKLQHHQSWLCQGRKGTSDVCHDARRPLSSNIFLLDQGGLVGDDSELKEGEKPAKEREPAEGKEVELDNGETENATENEEKVGSQQHKNSF